MEEKMLHALEWLKKCLVVVITCMVALVLILSVIELGYMLVKDIVTPPVFLLDITEILELFGLYMLVLIGIELLETMEIYIKEHVIHVEVVFTVALIAVARKVIILDVKKLPASSLFAIGFVILALSVGYYMIQKALSGERVKHASRVAKLKEPGQGRAAPPE